VYSTTSPAAADLTVATVDLGAVQDLTGEDNPEGDAPLGSTTAATLPAGITDAPDLVSISNFHTIGGDTTNTYVDFKFDEVVSDADIGSTWAHLIKTDGLTVVDCVADSGEDTDTVTVRCPDDTANVPLTASQFARATTTTTGSATPLGTGTPSRLPTSVTAATPVPPTWCPRRSTWTRRTRVGTRSIRRP